jgi:hypothetical protein
MLHPVSAQERHQMKVCQYVVLQRLPVSGEQEKRHACAMKHITLLLHELAFHKAHFGASDEQSTIGNRLIHQRTIEADDCR